MSCSSRIIITPYYHVIHHAWTKAKYSRWAFISLGTLTFFGWCVRRRPCQPPTCWPSSSCCFLVFFLAWFFSACSCIESGSGVNTLGFYGMPDGYYTTVKRLSKCIFHFFREIKLISRKKSTSWSIYDTFFKSLFMKMLIKDFIKIVVHLNTSICKFRLKLLVTF